MKAYMIPAGITVATLLGLALSRSSEDDKGKLDLKIPPLKLPPGWPEIPMQTATPDELASFATDLLNRATVNPQAARELDPATIRILSERLTNAGYPKLGTDLLVLATALGGEPPPPPPPQPPTFLPPDLAAKIATLLNPGIPQRTLGPIDAVIAELAKIPGFEDKKTALLKRRTELKQQGL